MNKYKLMIVGIAFLMPLTGCASKKSSDAKLLAIKKAHQQKEWNKEEAQEEKKFNEGIREMKSPRGSPKSVPTVLVWLYNV